MRRLRQFCEKQERQDKSRAPNSRSTGRATADWLGPVGGTRHIFANRAKPVRRVAPVSSNVGRLTSDFRVAKR